MVRPGVPIATIILQGTPRLAPADFEIGAMPIDPDDLVEGEKAAFAALRKAKTERARE